MDPTTLVPLLKPLIDRAQPEWRKHQAAVARRFADETSRAIAEHHISAARWCEEEHNQLTGPLASGAGTIELTFRDIPRRLGIHGRDLDELDVLLSEGHYVVLGDPGAGKTTTLRRLTRHVALEPEVREGDPWKFVVVIVCREEEWDQRDIYASLGEKIGVKGKLLQELDNVESRIREVLDVGSLIVVDGLDEVPPAHRINLQNSIVSLGRHLRTAKVVISCRSGDYTTPLPGFEVAEIQPLTQTQIDRVVEDILGPDDAKRFVDATNRQFSPARDLTDRPLYLTQMITIFRRQAAIPDRPVDLYEAISRLVLRDWDEHRGLVRTSSYAKFSIENRLKLLADLALLLMQLNLFRFKRRQLAEAYRAVAPRYDLPKDQANVVVQELESHTGLIVQSGDQFEFSHLSLQEYLAADALVRGPSSGLRGWSPNLTAVAAVSVALSSDPNLWLHELVRAFTQNSDSNQSAAAFLNRIAQERPRFVRSVDLGHDALELLRHSMLVSGRKVETLVHLKPLRDSIADAILGYEYVKISGGRLNLNNPQGLERDRGRPYSFRADVIESVLGPERFRQVTKRPRPAGSEDPESGSRRSRR